MVGIQKLDLDTLNQAIIWIGCKAYTYKLPICDILCKIGIVIFK